MNTEREDSGRLGDAWRKTTKDVGDAATQAVANKAKDAGDTIGEIADEAKEKVQEWASCAAEAATQVKDKAQEWASSAAVSATHAKDKAQEWAAEAADKTGQAAKSAGHEMTDLIRRYPVPSLLIGFGLGYLLARASRSS